MRKLILIFALAAPLWCANTVVTGTIVAPTGDRPNFSCTFRLALPVSNGVYQEVGGPTQVQFTGGNLSVSLLPTDQMVPSDQAYSVTCGWSAQQVNGHALGSFSWGPYYWIVPTSTTPVAMNDIAFATQDLALASLSRSWATLTNAQWLTLTNVQWTTGMR